jgi:hypothetical protein
MLRFVIEFLFTYPGVIRNDVGIEVEGAMLCTVNEADGTCVPHPLKWRHRLPHPSSATAAPQTSNASAVCRTFFLHYNFASSFQFTPSSCKSDSKRVSPKTGAMAVRMSGNRTG